MRRFQYPVVIVIHGRRVAPRKFLFQQRPENRIFVVNGFQFIFGINLAQFTMERRPEGIVAIEAIVSVQKPAAIKKLKEWGRPAAEAAGAESDAEPATTGSFRCRFVAQLALEFNQVARREYGAWQISADPLKLSAFRR